MHMRAPRSGFDELTPRQREVIALIAKGRTNPEIATELGMTIDGAKWHVREILSKLSVDSREEAVRAWRQQRHGLPRTLILLGGGATAAAALVAIGLGAWLAWPQNVAPPVAAPPSPTGIAPSATVAIATSTDPASAVAVGKPIEVADAMAKLPASEGEPEAAYDGKLIVVSSVTHLNDGGHPPQPTFDETFRLWDPTTGESTPLWTTPGSIATDSVTSVDGDWAAVVGTWGDDASAWRITLHNLRTGEVRNVAEQASSRLDSGATLGGIVSDGHVYWGRIEATSESTAQEQIERYSIADGTTTTLAESAPLQVTSPHTIAGWPDVWGAPTVGGGKIAWSADAGNGSRVVNLLNIATGVITQPASGVDADPSLTSDGRYLGWVDNQGMHILDLDTGQRVTDSTIGNTNGGPTTLGFAFSWYPPTNGGTGGFYDPGTNTMRLAEQPPDTRSNVAEVMGNWFVWQIFPSDGSDPGYWAIVPLMK